MRKPNFFNKHLIDTGENFFEHFLFAFTTGLWLIASGLALIIHGFFPFVFAFIASKNVQKINQVMQTRIAMLLERKKNLAK